jgi:hypothetical protein
MNRAMKIGVWFALAAVIGLWSQTRGGTATSAPKAAKIRPAAPATR